jgi:hypothetical protein
MRPMREASKLGFEALQGAGASQQLGTSVTAAPPVWQVQPGSVSAVSGGVYGGAGGGFGRVSGTDVQYGWRQGGGAYGDQPSSGPPSNNPLYGADRGGEGGPRSARGASSSAAASGTQNAGASGTDRVSAPGSNPSYNSSTTVPLPSLALHTQEGVTRPGSPSSHLAAAIAGGLDADGGGFLLASNTALRGRRSGQQEAPSETGLLQPPDLRPRNL